MSHPRRRKGPTLAEAIVEVAGPERAAAIGRQFTYTYFVGVAIAQILSWAFFFTRSAREALGVVGVAVIVVPLLIVAFLSIRTARFASPWIVFLIAANVILLLVADFATFYWAYGTITNWSLPLSHWDALYVALGTLTTAGTGDVQPHSELTRRLVTLQMGIDLVLFTLIAGLVASKLAGSPTPRSRGR